MSDPAAPTQSLVVDPDRADARTYLLVIDGASSRIVVLPARGVVAVGRAPDCDVQLADAACSRRHAQLHVGDDEVVLEDLGSHNGTRVNGDRVAGRRALVSDDVIGIGPIQIVLHAAAASHPPVVLEPIALRDRLAQEVERALSYERALSVAIVALPGRAARDAAAAPLGEVTRRVDVLGALDDRHLVILMPELVPEAARERAAVALDALRGCGATAIGLAHCPADASRGETLVAAARAAAALADGVHEAAECVTELALGGAIVLVADAAMLHVYDLIKRLAPSDLSVLISGETGAGKENAAHALHAWSRRAGGPFVAINCASLPDTLVESELFGYEKGAFSGAVGTKAGRLESADGGTIFFDEIGELPLAAQAKLLRVLETRRVARLGALKEQPFDARVVAATNRDLEAEVTAGRFRQDLFFRLGGAKVVLPALRDRPRELAVLARHFLERACGSAGRPAPELSAAALAALGRHRWPGNVRELKNEMEYLAATVLEPTLEPWHLSERIARASVAPARAATPPPSSGRIEPASSFRPIHDELRDLERRRMREALAAAGGVQRHAAELIGMPVRTFTMKYKQYGLGDA